MITWGSLSDLIPDGEKPDQLIDPPWLVKDIEKLLASCPGVSPIHDTIYGHSGLPYGKKVLLRGGELASALG